MATDINEELGNVYNAAKQAINDDLKQNFYNAAQARTQAFRQLNNNANARHALYSGMPAATQMQYDRDTYLPGTATMVTNALARQQSNQEQWDKYMDYVQELNKQADYYNNLASKTQSGIGEINAALDKVGTSKGAGGLTKKPADTKTQSSTILDFGGSASGGGGGW